jgi:hypothetical protein
VERSHVHTRSPQATHAFRRLVDGDHKYSVESLQHRIKGNLVSPITEAWRNLGISSVDLDPVHRFAQPGLRPRDLFPGRIVLDIVKPPAKADKDRKEFMAERNRHLAREVDAASHSPQCVCIVTDTSTPPFPSSQSRLTVYGTKETCTPTGELPVSPHPMTLSCKQLQPALTRRMTLVSRTYVKYMCSQTP